MENSERQTKGTIAVTWSGLPFANDRLILGNLVEQRATATKTSLEKYNFILVQLVQLSPKRKTTLQKPNW